MKEEDIADLIKKYTKKDAEQDEKARAELQRTNAEAELLALQVMEKKQYLDYREQWNFHIKSAFWLYYFLIACITLMSLLYQWQLTLNLIVGLTTFTQAVVLVLVKFIFPRLEVR